jgi:hypothetical protein
MATMELDTIEQVDIREIWKHEEYDFSQWLAKDENIALLSKEIGIQIKIINTEAKVGSFFADILAETSDSKNKIIIENQLEETDHDHLGKLITYASVYNANILIWIFRNIKEEHRRAIDWLNEKAGSSLYIFAIKIEAWKIGNSKPAPKFHVICSPNEWGKNVKNFIDNIELSEMQTIQLEFWTKFNKYLKDNNTKLKLRKPLAANWYVFSIGNTNVQIECTVYFKEEKLVCGVGIYKNDIYKKLLDKKDEINNQLGFEVTWEEYSEKEKYLVLCQKEEMNIKEIANYDSLFKWLKDRCEVFSIVFPKYY